jgi:hypothetical protein
LLDVARKEEESECLEHKKSMNVEFQQRLQEQAAKHQKCLQEDDVSHQLRLQEQAAKRQKYLQEDDIRHQLRLQEQAANHQKCLQEHGVNHELSFQEHDISHQQCFQRMNVNHQQHIVQHVTTINGHVATINGLNNLVDWYVIGIDGPAAAAIHQQLLHRNGVYANYIVIDAFFTGVLPRGLNLNVIILYQYGKSFIL